MTHGFILWDTELTDAAEHFIKVNKLKLAQVELFSLFHFMCVAANTSELFCVAHLANIERFLYHYNVSS